LRQTDTSDNLSLFERLVASFDSRAMAVIAVLVSGVLAGLLEFITHLAVAKSRPPLQFHAEVDAAVMASITMILISVIIAAARARRRQVLKEVETVAELNHHVRNALQVIRDSHLLPEDRQAQAVIESVERIDRTLRHLFPPVITRYNEKKVEMLQKIALKAQGSAAEKKSGEFAG
jgi:hypothetical protein